MYLELDGNGELYRQLLRALERAIHDGRIPAGSRLPSSRQLADELGVARNTVLAAYDLLCAEQLAVARGGSGTYAAGGFEPRRRSRRTGRVQAQSAYAHRLRSLPPLSLPGRQPGLRLDLQYGEPIVDVALFSAWRRSLAWAAMRTDSGYPGPQGARALREQIAAHLGRRRGVVCEADDVLVVNGTQQAIALMAQVLLDAGDAVALEDPHYQLAAHCLAAHGAALTFVPVGRDGLDLARLAALRARLVVVTPSHQFPSGHVMPVPCRTSLLALAAQRGMWVLEDDYDGEFGSDGRMLPALRSLDADDRVVYVGTFSKSLLPSLRLGYIVCPKSLRDDAVKAKLLADLGSNGIEQAAVAHFMSCGGYERHLRKAGIELRRRRRALLEGLARHCGDRVEVNDSGAGMHMVGWLPGFSPAEVEDLRAVAAARGLGVHAIGPHYHAPPPTQGLLLGFAALSVPQLGLATRMLGECLGEVVQRRAGGGRQRPAARRRRVPA